MKISGIDSVAYTFFGKRLTQKGAEYIDLQQKLVQARIGVPFDVFLAKAYLVSIIMALPSGIAVYLLLNENFKAIFGNMALVMLPLLSILFGFMVYNLFLSYPGMKAALRRKQIDIAIPHALALMHALSRGSSDIISFFEVISQNKKLYGEVSEETKGILIDLKVFNMDIQTALKNAGKRTPSVGFRSIVEGLSTVITTGGDLVDFFLTRSEQYRLKAIDENKSFMEILGLLSEVYITGFAVGPLFIITLLVVLGIIGGANFAILYMVVYILIPGGALMFIVLLSSVAGGQESELIETRGIKPEDEELTLQKAGIRFQVIRFLKAPLSRLIEKPELALNFSVPVAVLYFILSTYRFYGLEFNQMIYEVDDYLVFTALIMFIPYSAFVEIHSRRIQRMIKSFPEFLNRLMSYHESGLTLASSLSQLRDSDLGILNYEVEKMNADVEWNGSVVSAFRNFGERVKTLGVLRVAMLLESASRITGNIKDTLAVATTDALTNKTLEEERRTTMKMQIIIIYISFFIFLYVVQSLVSGFLKQMPNLTAGSGGGVGSAIGQGISFTGIDKPLFTRLFFHAAVLVGFSSGLVAGQIGEGDARLGLKHSIVMVIIAYALFSMI